MTRLAVPDISFSSLVQRLQGEYPRKLLVTAAARVTVAAASVLLGVFLGRTLGTSGTGTFYFCLTVLMGSSFLARLGQDQNMVWLASRADHDGDRSGQNGYLTVALLSSLLVSLLGYALVVAVLAVLTPAPDSAAIWRVLPVLMLALPAVSLANVVGGSLKGVNMPGRSVLLQQGGASLISLAIALPWLEASGDLDTATFAVIFVAGNYLLALLGMFWWLRVQPLDASYLKVDWAGLPGYFRASANMGAVAFLSFLMHSGPIFLTGLLADQVQVGLFAVSERLVVLQYFLFSIVLVPIAPRLSGLYYANDSQRLRSTVNRSAAMSMLGALPFVVLLMIWPESLLGLFGTDFLQAADVVRWLSAAYLVSVMLGGGGYILMISGHGSQLRNIHLFSSALLVLLCTVLVPSQGAMGAALSAFLVNSVRYVATQIELRRQLDIVVVPRW